MPETQPSISLRQPTQHDVPELGRILYEAFKTFHEHHRFRPDVPSLEMGVQFMDMLVSHPRIYGVVAEVDGRIAGSNFLDERDTVRGVGPITVDPSVQARGIGKRLMQAVIRRGHDAPSVRLVQDAFNTASMSLYTALGFDAREPLALIEGKCRTKPTGSTVRAMTAGDLPACGELCRRVHGFDRNGETADHLKMWGPMLLERDGRVVAYCSAPSLWLLNHGVAETDADMRDLLLGASHASPEPLGLLMPIRNAALFRWALTEGLRVLKPMTLMSMGTYHEPKGSFFPSVLY